MGKVSGGGAVASSDQLENASGHSREIARKITLYCSRTFLPSGKFGTFSCERSTEIREKCSSAPGSPDIDLPIGLYFSPFKYKRESAGFLG
mmetsp:Transcript_17976/g.20411  ORF Transcript_17976/g.20411 Transcript_17976/m.20411 type:complete len:91 (-) Transcript_17976:3015-3287(-)